MEKLPEDFKQKWIAALRSGEYKQGTGELFNSYSKKYCCLGVAGRIANVDESILLKCGYFEYQVRDIPKLLVSADGNAVPGRLITMNDSDEKSFSEIADYIEANL